MQERTLLKISTISILLGIPLLIILSLTSASSLNNPENILLEEDPEVFLNGKIIKIQKHSKLTKLTVKYEATIPVILFDQTDLKQGDRIRLRGKIEMYKGNKQLLVNDINRG